MKRATNINKLRKEDQWDIIIIGGGASGLGAGVEASTRGYKTILFEQSDFAKGTSSRSTKLVHGGVRYLAQGDISLVLEALRERGFLRRNAPHLVRDQQFIIPSYDWWDGPFYTVGLKVYDLMSGKLGLGPSEHISKKEVLSAIPNLITKGLKGGIIYYDGQFDDARLAINLAQTMNDNGGVPVNYMKVTGLRKDADNLVKGVKVEDTESGETFEVSGKVVVNATGVFADSICRMDDAEARKSIVPSQGIHLVLDKKFLQGEAAIMIPKTSDGRVLFAVPWHNRVIVGTTDTLVHEITLEPRALDEEITFILETAHEYLALPPERKDVLSVFAGLRPLVAPEGNNTETKEVSRNHKILVSLSGLVTMVGGKWTTYRKMGEDVIDKAIIMGGLEEHKSVSEHMPIHGYVRNFNPDDHLHYYGSDATGIRELMFQDKSLAEKISENFSYMRAEVIWAVRHEMARTVEDFLARRIRLLLLDARASKEAAPVVAELMARELGKGKLWVMDQVEKYKRLADNYHL